MIFKALWAFTLVAATTTMATTVNIEEAKTLAAEYDEGFLLAFLDDLSDDHTKYTSYMVEHSMTFPGELIQFYYDVYTYTDYAFTTLIPDQFPFTQFKTFISAFPWYTTLLEEASISTMAVPDDFLTTEAYAATSSSSSSISSSTSIKHTTTSSTAKTASSTTLTSIVSSSSVSVSKSSALHSSFLTVVSSLKNATNGSSSISSIPATETISSSGGSKKIVYPWVALSLILLLPLI